MDDYAILRLYTDDVRAALGRKVSLSPAQLSRIAELFWNAIWEDNGWAILREVTQVVLEEGGARCGA